MIAVINKKWLLYKIVRLLKGYCLALLRAIKDLNDITIDNFIDIFEEHYYDKKFGIETDDSTSFKNIPESFQKGIYKDGVIFQSSKFRHLKRMADCLKLDNNDVFIDFGSGKGRVLFFVAQYKLKKVIGVDINKNLVLIAIQNQSRLKLPTPVEIIHGDATQTDVREGTVFFFYNPFGIRTFVKVLNNIKDSLKINPRRIRIVYFNSVYYNLLDSEDWLEKSAGWGGVSIWHNKGPVTGKEYANQFL